MAWVAPEEVEYVPSLQSVHLALVSAPVVELNVPAEHSLHVDASGAPEAVE
jgi:hypothetical protein